MIVFDQVSKQFAGTDRYAVKEVSLKVEEGETLVLLGSSGSGKTTLLRLVNRLIEPSSGRILLDQSDVSEVDPVQLRRRIGYVFQGMGLFPHLSVGGNVGIVLKLLGWPDGRRRRRVSELLALVGLEPAVHTERFPDELSGGQQQRVGVARALAADPKYLLMDEPFGALDAITRDHLQQELLRITRRLGKTILFVTHDIFEALALGDRIAVMHEGRLEQTGSKDEILRDPASDFVRDLFAKPAAQLSLCRSFLPPDE